MPPMEGGMDSDPMGTPQIPDVGGDDMGNNPMDDNMPPVGDDTPDDGEGMPEDYDIDVAPEALTDVHTKMKPESTELPITINGKKRVLSGKKDYIFVDIYNVINFDPSESNGRPLITKINGRKCGYSDELHENDEIEVYWNNEA